MATPTAQERRMFGGGKGGKVEVSILKAINYTRSTSTMLSEGLANIWTAENRLGSQSDHMPTDRLHITWTDRYKRLTRLDGEQGDRRSGGQGVLADEIDTGRVQILRMWVRIILCVCKIMRARVHKSAVRMRILYEFSLRLTFAKVFVLYMEKENRIGGATGSFIQFLSSTAGCYETF